MEQSTDLRTYSDRHATRSAGKAYLWDNHGKPLATLKVPQGKINIVFSTDSQQLAASGADNITRLWQMGAIDELLSRECDWVRDYLKNSPNVAESDRLSNDNFAMVLVAKSRVLTQLSRTIIARVTARWEAV